MSENNLPCVGGNPAILQVVNTDCSCISIARIVNNQPTQNSFTIFLSNGQSITLPLIQGVSGTIAMQVDGGYIQYSANGGAWINLIALSAITGPTGANGTSIIFGDAINRTTGATTGATVQYISVPLPANTFAMQGSTVEFDIIYTASPLNNTTAGLIITDGVNNFSPTFAFGVGIAQVRLKGKIMRSNTSAADATTNTVQIEMTADFYTLDGNDNYVYNSQLKLSQRQITGLNFANPMSIIPTGTVAVGANNPLVEEFLLVTVNQVSVATSAPTIYGNYANDAAAAAAGVPIGGYYINSATGAITQRLV